MNTKRFTCIASSLFLLFTLFSGLTSGQNVVTESSPQSTEDWFEMMQDPNVNFYEVQSAFYKAFEGRTDLKGTGYKIFKRWEYINEFRVLSDGRLQAPDYVKTQYEKYMKVIDGTKSASGNWTVVGPTAYPVNNTSQPTGMGRINAIAFHPTNADIIFVGAPSGGFWKTIDGGNNWTNLSGNLPTLGVSSILVDPNNADIIYLGTGDRDGGDAPGIGVYKSEDGGLSWDQMNNTMGNVTVGAMVMHPDDEDIILAATSGGIYKTTDGGSTWSAKLTPGNFKEILFKPGDPTTVYATYSSSSIGARFYRSTNNGDNWTQIKSGILNAGTAAAGARMVIAVAPSAPAYVYLLQIEESTKVFQALLKSTDSGENFSTQSTSPNIMDYACDGSGTSSQATYDLCITVDPTDSDVVYVGSINNWKSADGGVNWGIVSHWAGGCTGVSAVHADQHCYGWNDGKLYVGHDGGISYTANNGGDWTEITNNLTISQIYKIGQGASNTNYTLIGCQDNGSSATTDGSTFTTTRGGDGTECVIDYGNSNYCYNTYITGEIDRSTTGPTGSYSEIAATGFNGISSGDKGAWVTPYMLHETDASVMFAGYMNVYRCDNVKASPASSVSWSAISSGETNTCRVLEQSPADEDILYVVRPNYWDGSQWLDGNFKRSDNANATAASVTWTSCTLPGGEYPTDLEAHPTNANIVYATVEYGVYKSSDKGATWTDITGNLPSLFTNSLVYDKNTDEGLYVGNQTGVWYKEADMTDWMLFSEGLPPVDVRELEIYYDDTPANSRIKAATYGRGLWESDLITQSPMTYVSSTTTQNNTSGVDKGSANQEILGVEIVTSGTNTPKDVTQFNFNTKGSTHATNDIDAAKIYFTGTSSVFSATNQFGVDFANPNGTFTINGTQTLNFGINYFWLVYDIKASAAIGNFVDAECSSITVAGNSETPSITAPFGKREINSCTYCTPTASTDDATGVTNVNFNTINNGSSGDPAYTDFTAQSTNAVKGNAYTLTVNVNTGGNYPVSAKAWIDWNQDCDFEDTGEEYDLGTNNFVYGDNVQTNITPSITIPAGAQSGNTVMRVRVRYGADPTPEFCGNHNWSEAEDYSIFVGSGATWDGSESTDWNTAGNWFNNLIPTGASDVTIPNVTNDPVINQDAGTPALCNNLTIETGATLTINPAKALTVNGTLTNSAGTSGLVIKSDATGTGSLIHSTTDVDATFERYMNNADWTNWQDGWHFLSSPVISQAINPAFTTDPYDLYCWYEPQNLWVNFKNTTTPPTWNTANGSTNFALGKGYMAAYDAEDTKQFAGKLNTEDVDISGLTVTGAGANKSWHLLGNPFGSALTWDASGAWNLSAIGGAIKIWNESNQSYSDLSSDPASVIPATNGFFVQVTTDPGSLTIPAIKRVHSAVPFYKNTVPGLIFKAISLSEGNAQESRVIINPNASTDYDLMYDCEFLAGYAPQFYSIAEEEKLSTNSIPEITEQTEIMFGFIKNSGSDFRIEVSGIETLPAKAYLHDLKTGMITNLYENPVYEFTSDEGDTPARFKLRFGIVGINDPTEKQTISAWYAGDNLCVSAGEGITNIGIFNIQGQKLYQLQLHGSGIHRMAIKLSTGVYFARIVNGGNMQSVKVIIQ